MRVPTEPARFLPLLVFGPLAAAASVVLLVRDIPAPTVTLGVAIVAGAAAASAAAWKGERWTLLLALAAGASVSAAFLTFGIGATISVGAWLVDPCTGACPP